MNKHLLSFFLIRVFTWPISHLPYSAIHKMGNVLGWCAFYLMPKFRKRALSNLSLASALHLSEKELFSIAKASFQNLMITCLEYAKLAAEKNIQKIAVCENPELAAQLVKQGKPPIFFCGHQANWEILFLEGSSRMPGVAIGRPIKNQALYDWVLAMREKFGGKIITPKNAIKEGLRGLKKGGFLGIVGDQGMPDSGFSCPFLGRNAWTSPVPAILSYRTGSPIIVATLKREKGKYIIHYADPIWPNPEEPMDKEIDRMMRLALKLFEDAVKKNPGQWLWQHNRWKQQTLGKLKRPFRQESLCVILPQDKKRYIALLSELSILRTLYPHEFITFMIPRGYTLPFEAETLYYDSESDLLIKDYRFKLVFDLYGYLPLKRHFLNLSAFHVFTLNDLQTLANASPTTPFSTLLTKAASHAS
jgi:KDO2-lipid IV(A) lauroyltransferase